ncbi:MAG: hypothetical protein KAR00_03505 [Candidatus Pacebacteria bacterium]|nr:hypothetical protein [Candidatus Paceibacterota bacterium]
MIYLFHGNDIRTSRKKLKTILGALQRKRPDATVFTLTSDNWNESQFEESLSGQGLFDRKTITTLDSVLTHTSAKEVILNNLDAAQKSENAFLFIEEKMGTLLLASFKKAGAIIENFVLKKKGEYLPNVFALTDAWAKEDKKRAWVLYQKLSKTMTPEEIHGAIFWQAKTVLLAQLAPSAAQSGLKPFVFKKAAAFSKKQPQEKITRALSSLLEMYHNVRLGKGELSSSLEKFLLK